MSQKRERREFTDEFKQQVVNLYNNGKPRSEIIKEYDLTPSALAKLINNYNNSGSFKVSDNRTKEDDELIGLRQGHKQLENDIEGDNI